ncbi:MAG TPA: thiamine phosphate synthase [Terriglobia bacterium]|nr:thiamine phosphate synthase [Terriglobia bacterium]
MPPAPFQLCYITDRHGLAPEPLLPRIQLAAEAGVDLIQLREKDLPTRELADLAQAAVRVCRKTETKIVINDRWDIAMAVAADGVHLGGQSLPAEVVRREAGKDLLMGVSCHSLDEAAKAEAAGADYILLGPIFETPSKLRYGPPLGLAKLAEVSRRSAIPVFALGGITVERVAECITAGAKGIAGIRIFQECTSLAEQVRKLRAQCPPSAADSTP